MQFTPVDDQILVLRDLGEATQGKLHVPDRAVERPLMGQVLAVGPGRRLDSGDRLPCQLRAGQRVLFKKYAGTDVQFDGAECMVLRESDVLGVIEADTLPTEVVRCGCSPTPGVRPDPDCGRCKGLGTVTTVRAGSRAGKTSFQMGGT